MAGETGLCAYFLVGAPDGRLLVDTADGVPRLPRWQSSARVGWNETAPIAAGAAEALGTRVVVLGCVWSERSTADAPEAFFELEPPGAGWMPSGSLAWVDPAPELTGRLPERERAAVQRLLEQGRSDPPVTPWAHPGWLDAVTEWLDERLAELASPRTGPVEQFRVWSISTVLRAPTDRGDVYVKSVPPLFAGEPPLTAELTRRHPGRIPEVLAVDAERRLLLMADLPAGKDMSELAPDLWKEAVRAYARMQLAWVGKWPLLSALGCPDRRLDVLERELAPALRDLPSMLPGEPHGLGNDELEALPALETALRDACSRLRAAGLPDTLDHGDLHAANVRIGADGPVFFDWTDGCLTVPFFSLVPLLQDADEDAATSLRDAYLEEWEPHLPAGDLVAAFEVAQLVGIFHLLVSYRRILAGIEPRDRWQWRRVIPWLARQLLLRAASRP